MLREYKNYRLLVSEKRLLQGLARHGPPHVRTKYEALKELANYLPELELEPPEDRKPYRFALPPELQQAIKDKIAQVSREQGWKPTFIEVLLAAARKHRERFPAPSEQEAPDDVDGG